MSNTVLALVAVFLVIAVPAGAQQPQPFGDEETLHYTINWPSGLELGEAHMSASLSGEGEEATWNFSFRLDAGLPGFRIDDKLHSSADGDLCSLELSKETRHGSRITNEETSFDQKAHRAHRKTLEEGGGESDLDIPECARDALTFLYFLRGELSRGRIPPPQKILLGAVYEVSLEPAGSQQVQIGEKLFDADQMTVTIKGPASELTFLVLVARDPQRSLARVTVPFEPGNFTMELAQE